MTESVRLVPGDSVVATGYFIEKGVVDGGGWYCEMDVRRDDEMRT